MAWRDVMCGELRARRRRPPVTVAGWADTRRDHGGLVFVDLRDHTGKVQLVINPERAADAAETAHEIRNEFVLQATGEVVTRAARARQPEPADRPGRGAGRRAADRLALDAAPVPARRGERRRDAPAPLPLARPAPRAAAAEHPPARADGRDHAAPDGGRRLRRHPDADPLEADAGGRARLPRPGAPAAGPLLRAAAVAADREAAARDRRASSATTRSRSASATRISAPTACRRSRSSTSRWRSPTTSSCSR